MNTLLSIGALIIVLGLIYPLLIAYFKEKEDGAKLRERIKKIRFYMMLTGVSAISLILSWQIGFIVLIGIGGHWAFNAIKQGGLDEKKQRKGLPVSMNDRNNEIVNMENENKKKNLPASDLFQTSNPIEALLRQFGQRIINFSETKTFKSSTEKVLMEKELYTALRERADEITEFVKAYVKATGSTNFPKKLRIPGTNATLDLPPIYHKKLQRELKKIQMIENAELFNAEAEMVDAQINLASKRKQLAELELGSSSVITKQTIKDAIKAYSEVQDTKNLHNNLLDENSAETGYEMVIDDIILKNQHLANNQEKNKELRELAERQAKLILKKKLGAS